MRQTDFNSGWTVRHLGTDETPIPITLPYDAMLREPRNEQSAGIHNIGWFEGHDYEYRKELTLKAQDLTTRKILRLDGVYHNAEIWVNGEKAAFRPYGYIDIYVDLTPFLRLGVNEIIVRAKNADQPNSRWYSGSGIYRPVYFFEGKDTYILPDGIRVRTIEVDTEQHRAQLGVTVLASVAGTAQITVRNPAGNAVLSATVPASPVESGIPGDRITEPRETVLTIEEAQFWDADHPNLYEIEAVIGEDHVQTLFGIRSLTWDTEHGLCVNGRREILRGACIHSDNQLLGAETYPEAEERRVRLLKEAGYNAIRSAHNPACRYLLEACDRLGMYVMDEYTDMWYIHKTKYDYANYMQEWYERDLTNLVWKDYTHPCVVMYSTGNEVAETAQAKGIKLTGRMTDLLHRLDNTRPVTCGVNIFFNLLSSLGFGVYSDDKAAKEAAKADQNAQKPGKHKAVGSEFYNKLAGLLGDKTMKFGATLHGCDVKTRDAFARLDIPGYNYAITRYVHDMKKYPNRLIVGSETFCKDAYEFMELAKRYPRIIGDFVWAGMDYLGEAGIGSFEYEDYAPRDASPAGWISAGSGRIDLVGNPIGEAYYTKVALEKEAGPFIAVSPVYQTGSHTPSAWKMSDAIRSWSWSGCTGNPAKVEVYSRAPMIELILNGRSLGCRKTRKGVARFRIAYADGTLEAVALDENRRELDRDRLVTAKEETKLSLIPETEYAYKGRLFYVKLQYTDGNGIWKPMEKHRVRIHVEGGTLVAAGNAAPYNPDGYLQSEVNTYYGDALAIIRTGDGEKLTVTATEIAGQDAEITGASTDHAAALTVCVRDIAQG
ncbi:beta-galactosidase [Lachnospiraceae bacterium NK3A20]|nr:beta-galactosidase [Lachnospiraceae bacterium NK3A20]